MDDSRNRRLEDVKDALDENAGSKALFAAAKYAVRMRGGTNAVPNGRIAKLLKLADEQGSVTAAQIAEVLDTSEIPVEYDSEWSIGSD